MKTNKKAFFKKYLQDLSDVALRGDATEESFYSSLSDLLKQMAAATGRNDVHITTLPKRTEAGNPDFRLWNGTDRIVGYIEAKKPTETRLDLIEESEQLRRYRATFPNLILTNFLEFRLYRNGERVETVLAGRPVVLNRLRTVPPIEKADELWALLDQFLNFSFPRTFTAETLAVELAKRTRFLREVVAQQLAEESAAPGTLTGFYEAFQKYLIGLLTPEDFADLYAQTTTYGLFAARTRAGADFSRRTAFDNIPHTIGVLRDLFRFISLEDLPPQLEWTVDDISEVLAVADAPGILDAYYRDGKGSDPIVHFYETFLAEYDPKERERRGVYYTPEPVVSYIVRSLHHLLKTVFSKPDGLASEGVTLLDPAAGTMTFVARAAQEAVREFEGKYGGGGREEFIRNHILPNFYAFELMMAPYAVGHLKMSFFLEELGHRLADDERVRFYLTNTLDMEELEQSRLPGLSSLAEESRLAGQVKKQQPILVILGNPPYSGHSVNRGEWVLDKIEDYKKVDGKPLGEKNPKWLQDDYVKFLRFAQWKIEQAGRGVVGMITNHGYLDNPTFRGMRQSLMQTFDDIYVLDLHGNTLKREIAPDGGEDKNVFDIRQGVAIAFFVRCKGSKRARVRHADLWGLREGKYDWLAKHNVGTTGWQEAHPKPGFYFFVPRDEVALESYDEFVRVTEIFPLNGVGMTTARDDFVVDFDKKKLVNRVRLFKHSKLSDDELHEFFQIRRKQGWDIRRAWNMVQGLGDGELNDIIVPVLYRPFDGRWIFYHDSLVWRTVKRVMGQMLAGENLGLAIGRAGQVIGPGEWDIVFCTTYITEFNLYRRGGGCLFPLYLYPDPDQHDLFSQQKSSERQPNLHPKVVSALKRAYRHDPSPEDILHYIYAVLYAPTYRQQYAEFLRIDFPRVPFTANFKHFQALAALGGKLVDLHLLKSAELDPPVARFQGQGDNRVAKNKGQGFCYYPEQERVCINKTQYFAPVSPEVWECQIGGYQICAKWLADRRERRLDLDEIRTYCRIVSALIQALEIQEEIDALYSKVEEKYIPIRVESK